jgi:hypothetical protein
MDGSQLKRNAFLHSLGVGVCFFMAALLSSNFESASAMLCVAVIAGLLSVPLQRRCGPIIGIALVIGIATIGGNILNSAVVLISVRDQPRLVLVGILVSMGVVMVCMPFRNSHG